MVKACLGAHWDPLLRRHFFSMSLRPDSFGGGFSRPFLSLFPRGCGGRFFRTLYLSLDAFQFPVFFSLLSCGPRRTNMSFPNAASLEAVSDFEKPLLWFRLFFQSPFFGSSARNSADDGKSVTPIVFGWRAYLRLQSSPAWTRGGTTRLTVFSGSVSLPDHPI